MKIIHNLIFDFDGTLADTAPVILATMQATIAELHLPPRSDSECRATVGLRLEEIPAVLWPENPSAAAQFAEAYRRIFDRLKRPLAVKCFPGVLDTIDRLYSRGYRMAIASSRSHNSLLEYVRLFGIEHCMSMIVGGNDVKHGKPAPEAVTTILESCGWRADQTLTVGDAPVDILMGRAAGTYTCAVTYGNGSTDQLEAAGPTYIINDFRTLEDIL